MYKLLLGLFLFSCLPVQATELSSDDIKRIQVYLEPWPDYKTCENFEIDTDYLNNDSTLKNSEEKKPSPKFFLSSGVEVSIPSDQVESIDEITYCSFLSISMNGPSLTKQFQVYTAADNSFSLQLKRVYGEECRDKFKDYEKELAEALLRHRPIFIQEKVYTIIPELPDFSNYPPKFVQTLLRSQDPYNPKRFIPKLSPYLNIRYLHPLPQGAPKDEREEYGAFFVHHDSGEPNYGDEELVVTFKVVQKNKVF